MASFMSHLTTVVAGLALSLRYAWPVGLVVPAIVPLVVAVGASYASLLSKSKAMASYSKMLKSIVKLEYQEGLVNGVGMGAIMATSYSSWALLCLYGGILTRKGIYKPADILSSLLNMLFGVVAIGYAVLSLTFIVKGVAAYIEIMEIINQTPILKDNIDGPEVDQLEGIIKFKNVCFSYPSCPDAIVLHDFNLLIPVRKTLALVGGNGSGKTTVISLLERFYEPTQGQTLIDELDIKRLNTKWLRQQIGLVSQEPILFSISIKENILYGKEDANKEEVMAAAKASNAHDFITNFPEGYNTKNPKILLLDEATSALDSASERLIQLTLNELMIGRTMVVIAHRLSTIKKVDTIAVMKDGCIVEMGSHDQLMAKEDGSAYFSLINLQAPDYSNNDTEQTLQVMPNLSNEKQIPSVMQFLQAAW
ncbi:hypothetical protein SUGI_0402040 [Cryptomeria japonica]|nr:hypothetical protein SUGI_0402040 [Cryptomeria japonica]